MTVPKSFRRVVIENVDPEINGGRFAITRMTGESVLVAADIFADGHDVLGAALQYRKESEKSWKEVPLLLINNDRWEGQFKVATPGKYFYTLRGWVDPFKTWSRDLAKKAAAGQDLSLDLKAGAQLLLAAAKRASTSDAGVLREVAEKFSKLDGADGQGAVDLAQYEDLNLLMSAYRNRTADTIYGNELAVRVDRQRARFSSWYEMFPRSCTTTPERRGTLRDCAEQVEYVAKMGFDVLYLPPIHPIGMTERKIIPRRLRHPIPAVRGPVVQNKAGINRFIRNWER
jgi:starch synthase (maltosyl-transferring)